MAKHFPFEAIFWFTALCLLALLNPAADHFSLCPFSHAGLTFCPGCGLGRSINLFFHGEVLASFYQHPLGIFAVIILSFRIINLTQQYIRNYGKSY